MSSTFYSCGHTTSSIDEDSVYHDYPCELCIDTSHDQSDKYVRITQERLNYLQDCEYALLETPAPCLCDERKTS